MNKMCYIYAHVHVGHVGGGSGPWNFSGGGFTIACRMTTGRKST